MRFLFMILISLFSGIFAGMGMGGGTFLIPLLYIFFKPEQGVLQSTNIICFLVLAIICFVIYTKNHLINFKALPFVAFPASVLSAVGTIFAVNLSSNILRIFFACFVSLIGVICLVNSLKNLSKHHN